MNNAKLALAVGGGYLLGRWHKGRWALALAGLVTGKKFSTNPGVLLGQLMESSPQLRELADDLRGELVEAGAKAAAAAAGNQLGGLTEQLRQRTEAMRDSAGQADGDAEEDQQDGDREEKQSKSARGGSEGRTSRAGGARKSTSGRSRSDSSKPAKATTKTAGVSAMAKQSVSKHRRGRRPDGSAAHGRTEGAGMGLPVRCGGAGRGGGHRQGR